MNVLFTGNIYGKVRLELYYTEELKKYVNLFTFDTRKILKIDRGYNWNHLMSDLSSITRSKKYDTYYRTLIDFCKNNDVKYYIWWNDKNVAPELLYELQKLGVRTIGVCSDDHAGTDYYKHWVGVFDLYLTTDPGKAKKFDKAEFFNPCCVLPYIKKLDVPKDIDVLFYGSLYPNRVKVLEYLKKELKKDGIDITVYSSAYNNEVFREGLNRLINRAKVTVHVNHPDVRIATLRFFEVLGSDNLLATDYYPEEIYSYQDILSGKYFGKENLLNFIRDAFEVRLWEARDGQREFIVKDFTVQKRVKEMISKIERRFKND